MMYNWKLLRRDTKTGLELWKTPSRFLICHRYCGYFKFEDSLQACEKQFRLKIEEDNNVKDT